MNDFLLFLFAIAKSLLLTSVGVGIAIAVIAERCGFRVVALGVEQVSGRAVSHIPNVALSDGNKPARNVLQEKVA